MSSPLLVRPLGRSGLVHDITPNNARGELSPHWTYVGFALHRLAAGESVTASTGDREALLVLISGRARIAVDGEEFGEIGERMSPWQGKPHSVYAPNGAEWQAEATTDVELAVCTAPGHGGHSASYIAPGEVDRVTRGTGTNERHIHPIAMEERDVADSLLVTEVFTPAGHWSSYPPHRHDEDDFPRMTYLEETYYHRLDPPQGYAHQRVFTEDGSLDETMTVHDGDVILVPRGHHPCAAPHGYRLYYLNVMAGPRRAWRFANHPDHDWIAQRDG